MLLLIKYTLLYGIVLMLVALGGMFSEHSGIINIALEGIMVIGGVAGVLTLTMLPASLPSWLIVVIAVVVAALAGVIYSLLLAFASINLKADQTIGGTALNLMAPALVLFLIRIIANQNTLQMATGDSASWFMLKKSTFGVDKNVDWGFCVSVASSPVFSGMMPVLRVTLRICRYSKSPLVLPRLMRSSRVMAGRLTRSTAGMRVGCRWAMGVPMALPALAWK